MGEIINRLLLVIALTVLLTMTFFIFFQYPAKWRKHPTLKYFLAFAHGVGSISIAIIFTCYSKVDNVALKWIISNCGSVYFMAVIFLFMLFGLRFMISHIARGICGKEKIDDFVCCHPLLTGRSVHSLIFLTLSVVITMAGFIRVDDITVREYSLTVSKPSAIKELDIIMIADIHGGAGLCKRYAK